jgi:hypothetical protein
MKKCLNVIGKITTIEARIKEKDIMAFFNSVRKNCPMNDYLEMFTYRLEYLSLRTGEGVLCHEGNIIREVI